MLLQGLITLKLKQDIMSRYEVQVMSSVHEVKAKVTFYTFVINCPRNEMERLSVPIENDADAEFSRSGKRIPPLHSGFCEGFGLNGMLMKMKDVD